jgi:hypothetical protein
LGTRPTYLKLMATEVAAALIAPSACDVIEFGVVETIDRTVHVKRHRIQVNSVPLDFFLLLLGYDLLQGNARRGGGMNDSSCPGLVQGAGDIFPFSQHLAERRQAIGPARFVKRQAHLLTNYL